MMGVSPPHYCLDCSLFGRTSVGYAEVTKTAPFATCWRILPLVSRSFAVVIRWLPRGLDDAVMVSYLLCRIADTLEDSVRNVAEKRRQLARFADSLDEGRPEIPLDAFPA